MIYCLHHSKCTQGQKRSMDRASGSGVFARDPDAMHYQERLVFEHHGRALAEINAQLKVRSKTQ
jgi:RecA-family ATPase